MKSTLTLRPTFVRLGAGSTSDLSEGSNMARSKHVATAALVTAGIVGALAAGVAYSALAIDHRRRLPPPIPGTKTDLPTAAGSVAVYAAASGEGTPLLLVHSVNAAASAYEMLPLFRHYAGKRPVYAIDLPGYGMSERRNQTYTARMMADAIHAAVDDIKRLHDGAPIDVFALSVSCEYAARVALERPSDIRTLALLSPTGFDKALSGYGRAQSTKGNALKLALVSVPLWSQALFDSVVSRPSMRFFLEKTFGSKRIDEGLFAYDQLTAHQPGARHVVWSFLSGYLFADDATRVYKALKLPVWTGHGRRGDFVDFGKEREVAGKPNWHFAEFDTGAMPQFERLDDLVASFDAFMSHVG